MRENEVENIYGFRRCIKLYIKDENVLKTKNEGKKLIETSTELWKRRPLVDSLLSYCAVDTLELFKLFKKLRSDNNEELTRLRVASERYVDMYRGKTKRNFDDFETNAHLPLDIIPEKGTLTFPLATTQCVECKRLFPHEEFSKTQLRKSEQRCRVCKEIVNVNRSRIFQSVLKEPQKDLPRRLYFQSPLEVRLLLRMSSIDSVPSNLPLHLPILLFILDHECNHHRWHHHRFLPFSLISTLPYGISGVHLDKLQRVLNSAARIVTLSKRRDHITPLLKDLHWLPVRQRINYKILLLTFKALHGLTPSYISELISVYKPKRTLRSSKELLLSVKPYSMKTYGSRSFSVAAPTLWNSLPSDLRNIDSLLSFKKELKTYLFSLAFRV
ncbi:hypothetical protein AC249_AIPGENE21209 [Exaiptasia diaphana]|nr:hypothetical protein AC249_AIPGENE21209 [Exaiptasia diaphana]